MDASGKSIMEYLLETKTETILEFIFLTFPEGTSAAWLHDRLKPHVSRLVVCDPRKAALLKEGNKNDRIDARKLAESLRSNQLKPVYHGQHGLRTLKELGQLRDRDQDVTRVMNRIKALYGSWAIPCGAQASTLHVTGPSGLPNWWNQECGFEPSIWYQQLDSLQPVRLVRQRGLWFLARL
jgi:transposase